MSTKSSLKMKGKFSIYVQKREKGLIGIPVVDSVILWHGRHGLERRRVPVGELNFFGRDEGVLREIRRPAQVLAVGGLHRGGTCITPVKVPSERKAQGASATQRIRHVLVLLRLRG